MKKIALDLDGVIFDSETLFRVYSEIYDIDRLKKDSLIDNSKKTFQERYSWSKDISSTFYQEYASIILKNANIMSGAEIVLKKLLEYEKYEFIIITARNEDELNFSINKLKEVGLSKVKIYHGKNKKIDILLNEKIDIIIDDDEKICLEAAKNNVTALYFKNTATRKITENKYLKNINNWGEIYKYLMLIEKK